MFPLHGFTSHLGTDGAEAVHGAVVSAGVPREKARSRGRSWVRLATHCTLMSGGDLQPRTYKAGQLPRRDTVPFTPRRPVVLS